MSKKKKRSEKKGRKGKRGSAKRRIALFGALGLSAFLTAWGILGVWFVHHPRRWLATREDNWPGIITGPLYFFGNPLGDLTDALGLTGRDVVYTYDEEAPTGQTLFAGAPVRTSAPAPDDIVILDRGEFQVGWSPKLRHPVWVAYHVPAASRFDPGERPNFSRDSSADRAPLPGDYTKSGYDRGHMAPNFAIASRFGEAQQRATFLMSNIAPQSPSLNRGVWRDVEHRIAELWTARWGEIWVIVGCIPSPNHETLSGTNIDLPRKFYQIIVAQEGLDIRVQAVIFDQNVPWSAWPTRYLATIDEIEDLTGLDFLPDLPSFIQDPLEAELPTRLWPIRKSDIFKQIALRFL